MSGLVALLLRLPSTARMALAATALAAACAAAWWAGAAREHRAGFEAGREAAAAEGAARAATRTLTQMKDRALAETDASAAGAADDGGLRRCPPAARDCP